MEHEGPGCITGEPSRLIAMHRSAIVTSVCRKKAIFGGWRRLRRFAAGWNTWSITVREHWIGLKKQESALA
jgi:hypothetical protein